MDDQNRENYIKRIEGLTGVFLKLNNSNDAVTFTLRNKKESEVDNRSNDEIKRDLKDYLI